MGLIGVAAVGRDSGRVLACDQAMDGMVEADQLSGALGRQAFPELGVAAREELTRYA